MEATIRIFNNSTEAEIRISDGGIATCRHNGDHMVSDYYQDRTESYTSEIDWEELAKGKIYCEDWEYKQEVDQEIIEDALKWLGYNQK
jgi:hypothetical protein